MHPFVQVREGEMLLTYAADEAAAAAAFTGAGVEPTRVRKQPDRKASAFIYTLEGENVTATVIGAVPPEFRDDEAPAGVEDSEGTDVLDA